MKIIKNIEEIIQRIQQKYMQDFTKRWEQENKNISIKIVILDQDFELNLINTFYKKLFKLWLIEFELTILQKLYKEIIPSILYSFILLQNQIIENPNKCISLNLLKDLETFLKNEKIVNEKKLIVANHYNTFPYSVVKEESIKGSGPSGEVKLIIPQDSFQSSIFSYAFPYLLNNNRGIKLPRPINGCKYIYETIFALDSAYKKITSKETETKVVPMSTGLSLKEMKELSPVTQRDVGTAISGYGKGTFANIIILIIIVIIILIIVVINMIIVKDNEIII